MSRKISVKVTPNAKTSAVKEWKDDILYVRIQEPPTDGKANKALIKLLSKHFNKPKSAIKILKGEKSRLKTIEIQ